MSDLTNRIAFVSGTSRGLGEKFALTLAKAGADLVVSSRTLASLDKIKEEVEALGRKCLAVELDVQSLDSIKAAVQTAKAHDGKVDIHVNNAGCNVRKPATEITWDDWNLVVDTNLRGSFFMAQQVAMPYIFPAKVGHDIGNRYGLSVSWVFIGSFGAS